MYGLDFGPAAGSASAERHPCVVVRNDIFNRSAIRTSVVCLITSNLSRANAPGERAGQRTSEEGRGQSSEGERRERIADPHRRQGRACGIDRHAERRRGRSRMRRIAPAV
ncbi:MAG: type II toxin-antitoxin system PemK/MazF family toxin [Bryobacteraceae bacterium]